MIYLYWLLASNGDIFEGDVKVLIGRNLLSLLGVGRRALGRHTAVQVVLDEVLDRIAQERIEPIDLLVNGVLQSLVVLLDVAEVHHKSVAVRTCELFHLRQILLGFGVFRIPFLDIVSLVIIMYIKTILVVFFSYSSRKSWKSFWTFSPSSSFTWGTAWVTVSIMFLDYFYYWFLCVFLVVLSIKMSVFSSDDF